MIRITMYCVVCKQYVDSTVTVDHAVNLARSFTELHKPECSIEPEEEPHGEDQEKPAAGPATATDQEASTAKRVH